MFQESSYYNTLHLAGYGYITPFTLQAMVELNLQVAIFRDLLLGVGSARDCPEMRERIRKVRMDAMQEVIKTNNSLLPHIKKYNIYFLALQLYFQIRETFIDWNYSENFTRITFDLFVIFIKKLLQSFRKMRNNKW